MSAPKARRYKKSPRRLKESAGPSIKNEERTTRAVELAAEGWSYGAISETLIAEGFRCGRTRAFQIVKAALEEATARRREEADRLVSLEMLRLDEMMIGVFPTAKRGDNVAISSVLAIMNRRAKYLGIDSPAKKEVTVDATVSLTDQMNESEQRTIAAALDVIAGHAGGAARGSEDTLN